jgi:hypothetical protein
MMRGQKERKTFPVPQAGNRSKNSLKFVDKEFLYNSSVMKIYLQVSHQCN